jgi:hypothetical protein
MSSSLKRARRFNSSQVELENSRALNVRSRTSTPSHKTARDPCVSGPQAR